MLNVETVFLFGGFFWLKADQTRKRSNQNFVLAFSCQPFGRLQGKAGNDDLYLTSYFVCDLLFVLNC